MSSILTMLVVVFVDRVLINTIFLYIYTIFIISSRTFVPPISSCKIDIRRGRPLNNIVYFYNLQITIDKYSNICYIYQA